MSLTQFAMVEELAFLVKDNLPCKHLILSMEDALVHFLQDDTSFDGVIELEPMNPYNRLLVHRLADIFGFSHHSVGEGEERHLILERHPDTTMPAILVSDLLSQFDEMHLPVDFEVLRRKEVIPGQVVHMANKSQRDNAACEPSLKERETAYVAARERIFSLNACQTNLAVKERPKKDPVVARRMITRALGQTNKAIKNESSLAVNDVKTQFVDERDINSSNELETKSLSTKDLMPCMTSQVQKFGGTKSTKSVSKHPQQRNDLTLSKRSSEAEQKESDTQKNYLKNEHMGAAKRLFANALGIPRRDANPLKCDETKKTDG